MLDRTRRRTEAAAQAIHDPATTAVSISWGSPEKDWSEQSMDAWNSLGQNATLLNVPVFPVPMPAFMMAPSCLATTGCLARQAILHAHSFPPTDADTSARDCRPLQQKVLDSPD